MPVATSSGWFANNVQGAPVTHGVPSTAVGEALMGILRLRIPGVSNRRMATENPDAQKSLRSETVHGAWDKHRASRKLAFAWFAHPACLCGCQGPLVRIKNTRKQHCFLQGHEAKLKALALRVTQGEASFDEISDYTRDLREMIRFLKKMPELRKAFE